ncbi:MAG: OmpA family protein [Hydrogenophilaceae bacterium]|nr:OmpA family protein [Hydrogenophilaceae bacterium]
MITAGLASAQAAEGKYYDPSNVASPKTNTIGYELFRTIGCPGKQLLDAGCPDGDADGDGVKDSKDKCPTTPKGRKVNAEGCELDGDGDGVVDALDKCPTTPKGRKVNAEGCELDGDGDGVVDALDKCPTVPAPGTADGCPVVKDSDGDGIMDDRDKCPTVAAPGTADGCPVPRKLVLEGVNFDNDKATLRPEAYGILDKAAATLKEWGDVKVEVAGHTDSRSDDDYNQKLSQRRADAVRAYLIGKGVAADRLTAKGYGESSPVADNESEEGRFKNRRVELVPQK